MRDRETELEAEIERRIRGQQRVRNKLMAHGRIRGASEETAGNNREVATNTARSYCTLLEVKFNHMFCQLRHYQAFL